MINYCVPRPEERWCLQEKAGPFAAGKGNVKIVTLLSVYGAPSREISSAERNQRHVDSVTQKPLGPTAAPCQRCIRQKKTQSQRDQQTTAMKPQQARKNRIFLQNGASFDRIQGKELRYEWNFMENFYKTVFWSRKSPILYNLSLPLLSARCGLTAEGDAAVFFCDGTTRNKTESWILEMFGSCCSHGPALGTGGERAIQFRFLMWFP